MPELLYASQPVGSGVGEVYVEYLNNRRVTGLRVRNTSSQPVWAEARFDVALGTPPSKVWGNTYPPGDTTVNLPNNLLTVVDVDKGDEIVLGLSPDAGIAIYEDQPPLVR
jgi:hypothetical protein